MFVSSEIGNDHIQPPIVFILRIYTRGQWMNEQLI